ncbi:hypothetical protein [Bifidobacterium breve]|uniref:hypothetical protein n=1 Tax=Bifidobacterium breve TaxID=1685 RepID=UPI002073C3D2|nr:hypothetical protein [Bifidobacterium breve]
MEYRFHHKANRYAAGELFDFPQFRRTASGEAEHECGENHAKHRHAGEHHHALRESGEIGVGGIRPIVHGSGRKNPEISALATAVSLAALLVALLLALLTVLLHRS